ASNNKSVVRGLIFACGLVCGPLVGFASPGGLMLTIFRRHPADCTHRSKGRPHKSCKCPIHCEGTLGREYIRQSLDTRSWEVAQKNVLIASEKNIHRTVRRILS